LLLTAYLAAHFERIELRVSDVNRAAMNTAPVLRLRYALVGAADV
jgi:hypothetical protein